MMMIDVDQPTHRLLSYKSLNLQSNSMAIRQHLIMYLVHLFIYAFVHFYISFTTLLCIVYSVLLLFIDMTVLYYLCGNDNDPLFLYMTYCINVYDGVTKGKKCEEERKWYCNIIILLLLLCIPHCVSPM